MITDALKEVRRYRRRVITLIGVAVGGFLLWASLTDLAMGVHVFGTVVLDTRRKVVQPQVTGVVRQVLVRDGQEVRPGDPIIILEQEKLLAEKDAMGRRMIELELAAERYGADLQGRRFQPDLRAYQERHPGFEMPTLLALAGSAASATTASLTAQLDGLDAQISRLSSDAQGARAAIELLVRQRTIAQGRLDGLRPVADAGLFPQAEYQRQEQTVLELSTRLEERQMAERSARNQIVGLTAERQRLIQENRRKLSEAAASVDVDSHQVRARLTQLEKDLASSIVRAAVGGQLIGFATTTVGSLVTAGQTIGQIVPKGEPLIVEAAVSPADIDRVRTGTTAEVRFVSLPRKTSPLLKGHVTYVSRDIIAQTSDVTKSASQQSPGYQIRVVIDSVQLSKLGKTEINPGMPVEIFSDGGTRSVIDYFVSPITQLFERAMREY